MKVKEYLGFRIAKCDVDEALEERRRAAAEDVDVVRVSAPPRGRWRELREAGFVCKPKFVRWYAATAADDDGYRALMSRKDRANLRAAERAASRAGLTVQAVRPVDAALMDEFLALYRLRVSERRRGLDIAGRERDRIVGCESFLAVVVREPDGTLAGMTIGRESPGDGAVRLTVSAVTERWRRASLSRVMYAHAASVARELGWPRLSAGTDPNLYGLIAEPGLYSFKVRLGFTPTAPEQYLPEETRHEADLVLRLDRLSDPTLLVGYRPGGDDLVLHVFGSDPGLDLRPYAPGLPHAPEFHRVGATAGLAQRSEASG